MSAGFLFLNEISNGYDSSREYIDRLPSTELDMGAGFIIPVHDHIGLTISGVYRKQKTKYQKGKVLALTVGINGLLFKSKGQQNQQAATPGT